MGVSKNTGTPKSSILIGFSIINHPFWGTPIFGNIHIPNYQLPNHQRQKTSLQKSSSSTPRLPKELFTCEHMPKGWEMMVLFQYFFVGENNKAFKKNVRKFFREHQVWNEPVACLNRVCLNVNSCVWNSFGTNKIPAQTLTVFGIATPQNGEPLLFWDYDLLPMAGSWDKIKLIPGCLLLGKSVCNLKGCFYFILEL